jgi:hypothetical protein
MSAILALGRLRQEDCKLKASPGYTARPCLKTAITSHISVFFELLLLNLLQRGSHFFLENIMYT